ncbi:MAG: ABC transporter permease [Gemmataceae bacterium]
MSSKSITENPDDRTNIRPLGPAAREAAPSVLREDEPTFARTVGTVGAGVLVFGAMAVGFHIATGTARISIGWSIFCIALGLAALLFHAAFDRDVGYRRLYMIFGFATLGLGVFLCLIPYPNAVGDLFRYGVPCLLIALLFLLAFLRNEDDDFVRDLAQKLLLFAGAGMAVLGLFAGNVSGDFFLPQGLVYSVVGLLFLVAFVGSRDLHSDLAYNTALAVAGAGVLIILIALGRSLAGAAGASYFVSYGVIFVFVGLLYVATGAGLALDRPVFILTRRELGAYFFSPVAYLTLLGFAVFSWFSFMGFLDMLVEADPRNPPIEPIVRNYLFALFPVFTVIFVVPILTMRLLSEEQRTGTMEVLLTAPVDETVVVLSKFLAALITYLVVWLPFGLFLLAIPLAGGNPFDYRPLLSFFVALVATGAAFVSMGLFFSSLTRNQIASGVLTFAGMLALTYVYFAAHQSRSPAWETVLTHLSYLDLWYNTLEGKIVPRFMLFPLSMTVLFLFLTVKVLESRKWR